MPLDELDWTQEEQDLLRSADLDAPRPGATEATLAVLGIGGGVIGASALATGSSAAHAAVGAGSTKAASAGALASKLLALAKWAGVIALAGTPVGVVVFYRHSEPPPQQEGAATPAPEASRSVRRARAETPRLSPEVLGSSAPSARSPARPPPAAPASASAPDISAEIMSLDRARQLFAQGDVTGALGELDRYDREFRRGRLGQEATLLRVQALLKKGDREAARALAERFLARHPESPLAPRVRKLVGIPEGGWRWSRRSPGCGAGGAE